MSFCRSVRSGALAITVLGCGVVVGSCAPPGISNAASPRRAVHPRTVPAARREGSGGGCRTSGSYHANKTSFISMGLALNRRGQVLVLYHTGPPGMSSLAIMKGLARYALISGTKFSAVTGPRGGSILHALSINDAGQVVGFRGSQAFVWSAGKTHFLHGLPGAVAAEAFSINDRGDVVGESEFRSDRSRATLWRDGKVIALGPPGRNSQALAINNHRQVAGWVANTNGQKQAALWDPMGRMTHLGTPRGDMSSAQSLNGSGAVVGTISKATEGLQRAVLWRSGMMTAIGPANRWPTNATGISEDGTICGSGFDSSGNDGLAFVWRSGRTTVLRSPEGAAFTTAWSINSLDDVVGTASFSDPMGMRAVVWTKGVPRVVQFRVPRSVGHGAGPGRNGR